MKYFIEAFVNREVACKMDGEATTTLPYSCRLSVASIKMIQILSDCFSPALKKLFELKNLFAGPHFGG